MIAFLSAVAVVLALVGALLPPLLAFIPQLGTWLIYRMQPARRILVFAGLLLALGLYAPRPTPAQAVIVGIVLFFLMVSQFVLVPNRVLVALDHPPDVPASQAGLGGDAIILGLAHRGEARAWPLESLVPHHMINDTLGGSRFSPLLTSLPQRHRCRHRKGSARRSKSSQFTAAIWSCETARRARSGARDGRGAARTASRRAPGAARRGATPLAVLACRVSAHDCLRRDRRHAAEHHSSQCAAPHVVEYPGALCDPRCGGLRRAAPRSR
jgi:hypothetical protein